MSHSERTSGENLASYSLRDSTISSVSLKSTEMEDDFVGKISTDRPDINSNIGDRFERKMTLQEMIDGDKDAFKLLINGQYDEACAILDAGSSSSFYHAAGKSCILSMRFISNLKPENFPKTWDAYVKAHQMINESRKVRSTASKATSILFKTDYSDWTDENCHAELFHAELSGLQAALICANDRSLTSFLKAALRLRACHRTFLECKSILKNKENWSSPAMRDDFEAGVHLGLGLFEAAVSYFPSNMIKLLELAGFSGNRTAALASIRKSAQLTQTLRYPIASFVLTTYYSYADLLYGLGEPDVDIFSSVVHHWLPIAPQSVFVRWGLAFQATWNGDFETAFRNYDECENGQMKMAKSIVYISRWQKIWLQAVRLNWSSACEQSRYLARNCRWSPSMFHYVHACLLSMQVEQLKSQKREQEASELTSEMMDAFKKAISLKRTFGGKRSFHEYLVASKAKYFLENPSKIVLVPLDLMYMWNIFIIASRNGECLPEMLSLIEEKLQTYSAEKNIETHAYLTFMRGMCYEYTNCPLLAVEAFYYIIDLERQLKENNHLVPQACFEIAQIHRRSGDTEPAVKWYKKAKSYNNYVTDGLIKFRSDLALRCIKEASA